MNIACIRARSCAKSPLKSKTSRDPRGNVTFRFLGESDLLKTRRECDNTGPATFLEDLQTCAYFKCAAAPTQIPAGLIEAGQQAGMQTVALLRFHASTPLLARAFQGEITYMREPSERKVKQRSAWCAQSPTVSCHEPARGGE